MYLKIQPAKTINNITFLTTNPVNSQDSSRTVQRVRKAFLKNRIHFHWHRKVSQLQEIKHLENLLKPSSNSDQHCIFTDVQNYFRKIFNDQKVIHVHKFSGVYHQQNRISSASTSDSTEFVLSLSKLVLTHSAVTEFPQAP
jgi:hypothetical protein